MDSLTIKIPSKLNLSETEIKRFLAAKMYEIGKLSLGQAADLAGLSKLSFSEILADYDVAFIDYSSSDIIKDATQF